MAPVRPLTAADTPALDRLLARFSLAGAYARSHLRDRELAPTGVRAYGCPSAEHSQEFGAAVVSLEGIAWPLWEQAEQAAALASVVPALQIDLLSGPRPLVAPLLAPLGANAGAADHCPCQRLTADDLRVPTATGPPARRATFDDLEALVTFYMRGFYSLAYLPTREAWRSRLSEQLAHRTLFLIEDQGAVLSAALSSAETPAVAMIGGVATAPSARKAGLSGRCVHALCTALFEAGVREIGLFYLAANTPAARLYDRLGFRPAGEWWLQRVGRP